MTDYLTLERIYPDEVDTADRREREALAIHVERYRFAAEHLSGARVLDMACGAGYGTALLAEASEAGRHVVGVDIDEEAVGYARKRYARPGIEFVSSNAMTFRAGARFDTIVSLETIEHLPEPQGFLECLLGLLAPGGSIIASVPTTPSVDANPNHLHDFTERSFSRMFEKRGFRRGPVYRQTQAYSPGAVAMKHGGRRLQNVRPNLPAYYLANPDALAKRIWSTLRYGFSNRYLTAVWRRR